MTITNPRIIEIAKELSKELSSLSGEELVQFEQLVSSEQLKSSLQEFHKEHPFALHPARCKEDGSQDPQTFIALHGYWKSRLKARK